MLEQLIDSKEPPSLGRALYVVLLAFLSISGVACAWLYQYGRAVYFNIPKSLIRVEISEVGLALVYLAPCLLPIFFAPLVGRAGKKDFIWIAMPAAFFVVAALLAALEGAWGIVGACIWTAIVVIFSLRIDRPLIQSTEGVGTRPWLAGLTMFSMFVSVSLGSVFARTQQNFYVMTERDADYVVLAMYGERLVLVPLAPDANTLLPRIEVRSFGERPLVAERWSLPSLTVAAFVEANAQQRTELRKQRVVDAAAIATAPR
jgi:hypothetical protein